ncbi:hypothetical protein JTE90_019393 [Oedothorax gibbosus]|uniref:Uncharacterized protein n=1 Tax=Oedothorax gibbosus TaxID=931172 RepID=A0AAV6TI43_9ARAC|nr:hypothetical protein JTE90_019393 [Oedothorax gibbosus]
MSPRRELSEDRNLRVEQKGKSSLDLDFSMNTDSPPPSRRKQGLSILDFYEFYARGVRRGHRYNWPRAAKRHSDVAFCIPSMSALPIMRSRNSPALDFSPLIGNVRGLDRREKG